jgi:hypothetical protein
MNDEDENLNPGAILARELNSLSLQERNTVLECIHGVDDVIKETPEMIESKLAEFQEALDRFEQGVSDDDNPSNITNISEAAVHAYRQAQSLSEEYVKNRKFRLMFLRAEVFDAPLAAQRMLIYLEEKLFRFGPERLTRSLTSKDLSPQSRKMNTTLGVQQLLPERDSAGRAIVLIHHDQRPIKLSREDPMAAVRPQRRVTSYDDYKKQGRILPSVGCLIPISHPPPSI